MIMSSLMGELGAGVILIGLMIGLAMIVPAARRRNAAHRPVRPEGKPTARSLRSPSSWTPLESPCDICGVYRGDKYRKLYLERRDYNVVNVTIYKRVLKVWVCCKCLDRIESQANRDFRIAIVVFLVSTAIGCVAVFQHLRSVGAVNRPMVFIIICGGLIGLVAAFLVSRLLPKRKGDISFMHTWQMKDLCKDAWTIRRVEE